MKNSFFLLILAAMALPVFGGESGLKVTYQPLSGLGAGGIVISQVTCHEWHSHSDNFGVVGLISAPNVPPTDNLKEATEDLNLASNWGIRFSANVEQPAAVPLQIAMYIDVVKVRMTPATDHSETEVIRACLECLRLSLPDEHRDAVVTFVTWANAGEVVKSLVAEFNAHDRSKAFFVSKS